MINSYGSLIKYNVEEFEKKSEMILWSDCSVMIFFFVSCSFMGFPVCKHSILKMAAGLHFML